MRYEYTISKMDKPNHPITDEPSKGVVAIIRNPVTDEDEECLYSYDERNLYYVK